MGINCDTALELLLEADLAQLAGEGETELAAHVRECRRCQAVAATLLEAQDELARALGALRPRTGVEDALSMARARRARALRWRRTWRWAAPVAAAAALAGVFILGRAPGTGQMPGDVVAQPAPRIEALIEAPVAKNVMVFETKDQSAKVIWFY